MVQTRATNEHPFDFDLDPEIDRTFHQRRRESLSSPPHPTMENETLRSLTTPNLQQQPLGVVMPALDAGVTYELKPGLIHQLPHFHGLSGEDPTKHLGKFHTICSSMKPANVSNEQIKMRAFGFTLKDAADDWYYNLEPGSITTWEHLNKAFLDKYFPSKRAETLKRAISTAEQEEGESLYDYNEHFKRMVSSCPYHGYAPKDLSLYLYNSALDNERRLIDASCGGNFLNITPAIARAKIEEIAEGTRTFVRASSIKK